MLATNNNFSQSKREATNYAKRIGKNIVYLYVNRDDQYVISLEPVETPYIYCAVRKDGVWYWRNKRDQQIDFYEDI